MQAVSLPIRHTAWPRWAAIALGAAVLAIVGTLTYVESGDSGRRIVEGPSANDEALASQLPNDPEAAISASPQYTENGASSRDLAESVLKILQSSPPDLSRSEARADLAGLTILDTHDVSTPDGGGWLQARFQTDDGRLLLVSLQELKGQTVDLSGIDPSLKNYEVLADGSEIAWGTEELTSFFVVVKNDQRLAVAVEGEPFNPENETPPFTVDELRAITELLATGLLI